jgi:hypothetical protein
MRQQFIHKNYHQWHRTCSLKYTGIEEDKGVSHCHGQVKRDAFYIIPLTLSLSPAGERGKVGRMRGGKHG